MAHSTPHPEVDDLAERPATRVATALACLPLLLIVAVGGMLAHYQGGYYLSQSGPAALVIVAVAGSLFAFAPPVRARLGRLGALGIGALLAYAAWSLLSISWAADRAAAWVEADRTLLYAALVFVVALLARLRPAPIRTALALVAVIPALLAAATLLRLPADAGELFYNGRLLGTIGYYNATATFLLGSFWAGLWISLERRLHPVLRALALGASTLAAATALLSQSRGALLSFALAGILYLALTPERWRALAPLAIAIAVAAAVALQPINAVYVSLGADGSVDPGTLRAAVERIWIAALATTLLAGAWAALDRRLAPHLTIPAAQRPIRLAQRGLLLLALLLTAAAVTVARSHDVSRSAHDAWARFREPTIAEQGGGPSRLTNVSNNGRLELWQTALDVTRSQPGHGVGAGNFEAANYQLRTAHGGYVRQPHNLTLEALSERGIVGAALLLTFFTCVFARAWRASRDPRVAASAPIVAVLAATVAEWLLHAQLEWLWQLPGASWSAFVAAGLLLAQPWASVGELRTQRTQRWHARSARALGLAASLAALLAVGAPWLADRYVELSRQQAASDPARALAHVRRAERLEPVSVDAAEQRLELARTAGDRAGARVAIRDLVHRSPEHWSTYMVVARYYAAIDEPAAAAHWRARARARNPIGHDFDVDADRERRQAPVTAQLAAPSTAN